MASEWCNKSHVSKRDLLIRFVLDEHCVNLGFRVILGCLPGFISSTRQFNQGSQFGGHMVTLDIHWCSG